MAKNYLGKRFTAGDVSRVAMRIKGQYGRSVVDLQSFLRAYDIYAKDSYIARTRDFIPTEEDASYLDGSDPNNFCANIAFKVLRGKFNYIDQEQREKPETEKAAVANPEILPEYSKPGETAKQKKRLDRLSLYGRQKGAIVKARGIYIHTRYGRQKRFIDIHGRYVSVKK